MGLFKKLFGANPDALEEKADSLFANTQYGPAKLAYEKALDAHEDRAHPPLVQKIQACTDAIARQRIDEAKAYLERGDLELAMQELEGAVEVAFSDSVRDEAQGVLDGLEAKDARQQAVTHEVTDEERIALIAGQWQEAQADEYESYGQPFFDALLGVQSERYAEARAIFEQIAQEASTPCYLWLEIGRTRLLADDLEGAKDAFERFLVALPGDEGGETRLTAHLLLARLDDDAGRFEAAMAHFEHAVVAMPEDYRPYLAMGSFLRAKGHDAESLEVLQTALELSAHAAPDWRLLEELGLANEAIGKAKDATGFLEQVIAFFAKNNVTDFPVTTAKTLAGLYEQAGRLDRAADMYRALSQGGDRANHALYHYEAGRLLQALGLPEEARRMLTRAHALAEDDGLRERIAAIMQD